MKIRKILAFFLSVCLIFGAVPITALAADQTNDGAGIRIQYVDESYDKTTGIMKVLVQAKLPASTGITSVGALLSYDNTKLAIVNQYNETDLVAPDGTLIKPAAAAVKAIMTTESAYGAAGTYSVANGDIYSSGNRSALYTYLYNASPDVNKPTDAQTSGNWFDVYEVMFRVAGKPDDPATVLNRDSLRIADVAKGDDAVMKGAFPANNIYSIYLTDNSDPAKLYLLNRMSGCTETEVTGEKSLMTAPETGTATYPGSTNEPPKPAADLATAPTGATGLTYDGTDQALLTAAGIATNGTMQYSLDNSNWSDAIPKGKDAGDYTVYYKVKGDSSHSDSAVANVSVKIDPKDISGATIGTIANQPYTGSAITPEPVVKDGTTTLVKGTDYTVSCTDNTYVGTNTAKLTITGKGNYTGTKDANFTINAIDQTPTFNTPASLVKGGRMLDLTTLVSGAKGDMTFTIPPGTTSATLNGHTLTSTVYTGTVNINVSITAKDVNNDGKNEYNAFNKDNAITVNVVDKTSNTTTMHVSQDDITYGGTIVPSVTDKPEDTGTVSYTYEGRDGTTYSSTTAPTNVGKYTVKATCESSTTIYTAEDDFEILPKSISGMTVTLDNNSLEYNGSAHTVNVTVKDGTTVLIKDTDYTVTSGNSGTDVSNYTVTVTGKGNYKDTAQATWKITPKALTINAATATGRDYAPDNKNVEISGVTFDGATLTKNTDYTATGVMENADAGTGKTVNVMVTLTGNAATNYTLSSGSTTTTVTINKIAFTGTAAKTVDILKNQTNAQSGTLTAADFFIGTAPAGAKITAVTPASATMMNNVSVNEGTLSYTSNTNITATSSEPYTVTITTKNYNNISATLTFQPTDKGDANVSVTGVPTASVTYGDSFTLNAAAADAGTETGTWTWSSSNSSVLAVTGNGATATVKVLTAGNATITVKYESDTTVDTETTAAITAVKRVISVKADDKSMTVNATLPTFTVTYGNFASGDTADTVFATKAVASTTTDGKTTGTFDITITTAPTLTTEMANKYEVGTLTNGTLKVNAKYSGGSYVPTVQKPEITIIGSGKADLSADGRTATITAAAGYELVSVVLNGKEMGKVEKLTGLKTGDKATITFQAKTDGKAEMDKMIAQKASKLTLMARSKKTAKLNIKVVVKGDLKAITDAGYTVKYKFYRSTKKSAGYKAMKTGKSGIYINTYGKKGTMYYYKARVMIYDKEGNFVAQTALKQCKYASRLWTK